MIRFQLLFRKSRKGWRFELSLSLRHLRNLI